MEKECLPSTSHEAKEDDEDEFLELDRIDKIMAKDSSDELKCLDFERQMFLDCIYNDGLIICGK